MSWGKLQTSDFPVRMQNSLANVYVGGLLCWVEGDESDSDADTL